jgi:dTDP-4-amino-4,6-dideoxygalactose transaminase
MSSTYIKIPIYKASFGEEDIKAAGKVIKSGNIVAGKLVEEFEKKFANYVGGKYAVGVNSCTSGLFLSLLLLKPKRVSIPSVTFASVANSILQAGTKLEFKDEIHVGHAYRLKSTAVWDSAHELEKGCFHGGLDCYSFFPTKLIGGLEGGMIVTDSSQSATWLKQARDFGMKRGKYTWDYAVEFAGWKMAMNEVQAAVGLIQLKKLNKLNKKRRKIVSFYNQTLGLENSSLHVYPIMMENRGRFMNYMKRNGIQTSVHYRPLHKQPAYKTKGHFPKSEEWGIKEASLPLFSGLSHKQVKYISSKVIEYRRKYE